ncbi:MAG: hypothetical protein ACR2MO_14425 [Acidimicrobiales bacterium]
MVAFLALPPLPPAAAAPGDITTVAGAGNVAADDCTAGSTALRSPRSVAVGPGGDVYFTDTGRRRVLKVDVAGTISTVAGTGVAGDSGDDGPATQARFSVPAGIAVDSAGNVYISDEATNRVRRVRATDGVITAFAGPAPATAPTLGDGLDARVARLSRPAGLAVDGSGNVYIADRGHKRIRRVDAAGIITTVAGSGDGESTGDGGLATAPTAHLKLPRDVAVDAAGNLFITDTIRYTIRKVDTAGIITTVAGSGVRIFGGDGGLALNAGFSENFGLDVMANGQVLVADTQNDRIRRFTVGGTIDTVLGPDELANPTDVAADRQSGTYYVADDARNLILKVTAAGVMSVLAGTEETGTSGDGCAATLAPLNRPADVALAPDGSLLVAERGANRIRRVAPDGIITTIAGRGSAGRDGNGGLATFAELNHPSGVAVGPDGSVYIADRDNGWIRRVSPEGAITTVAGALIRPPGFAGDGGPAVDAQLSSPTSVTLDGAGNIYVADEENHRVRKITAATGVITTVAGVGGADGPDREGGFRGDGGPATAARLSSPTDVALDAAGNLYICDAANSRIRRVDPTGIITTVAGIGFGFGGDGGLATAAELAVPTGITVAGTDLFVTDTGNQRVRRIDALGGISTVAGNGELAFTGDGGPATAAALADPGGLTVNAAGDVYFADSRNNRVRRVEKPPAAPPPTITTVPTTPTTSPETGGPAVDTPTVPAPPGLEAYWLAGRDGGVFAFGAAPFAGSATATRLASPIVAMAATVSGQGYWLVGGDGGVFAFGNARYRGSLGRLRLNAPVVAIAATPSGNGYWLVAADGGVFAFGDARYRGSGAPLHLERPIVAAAATPSGNGYWLVASDGGVFAFGDARYRGSLARLALNAPVVAAAATPSGNGYWLVASDGGVFAFGDARYRGSLGRLRLQAPLLGIAASPSGNGYALVAADGGVFAFGDARYRGSAGALRLREPIVAAAGFRAG